MQRQKFKSVFAALTVFLCCAGICAALFTGAAHTDVAAFADGTALSPGAGAAYVGAGVQTAPAPAADDISDLRLVPGGIPFGVKMKTDGVLIVGFDDVGADCPAAAAGLMPGDVITGVDGEESPDAGALVLAAREGNEVELTFLRGGTEYEATVIPVFSAEDGDYRLGLRVRDRAAGIGTVTFYDPESGFFAGLGHGICDGETGALLPLEAGEIFDVRVECVSRGEPGDPGEIRGSFASGKTGALTGNTPLGAFGYFAAAPDAAAQPMALAPAREVEEGEAEIICTLGDDGPQRYTVLLKQVDADSDGQKNFVVTVTDPDLVARTGGIIQGMSGSPIIQNGKLAGALTHVLVDDPTRGFGVFIENMLAAASDAP